MENAINKRIKCLLKHYGLSVLACSKKIGIPQTTLNKQIKGEREVSIETLLAILDYNKEVSAEWLIRGTGEMLLDEATKKDVPTSSDSDKDEEIKNLKEEIIRLGKEVSYLEGKISVLIDDRVPREKDDQEGESA